MTSAEDIRIAKVAKGRANCFATWLAPYANRYTQVDKSMHRLISSNFRKAVANLNSEEASFGLGPEGLSSIPYFFLTGPVIHTIQKRFFSYYAFIEALKGFLRSLNYLSGSAVTLEKHLLGPSTALAYTASFHLLASHLALEGRPHFETVGWAQKDASGSFKEHDPGFSDEMLVVGILTKNNEWIFEKRMRSHKRRWRELDQFFKSNEYTIRPFFRTLFRDFYGFRHKPGIDILTAIEKPTEGLLEIEDCSEEFLDRISETRHRALYQSNGEDPWAADAMWNGESVTRESIESQSREFLSFAQDLAEDVSRDIWKLVKLAEFKPSVKMAMSLSLYLSYFESPSLESLPRASLRSSGASLIKWLKPEKMPGS